MQIIEQIKNQPFKDNAPFRSWMLKDQKQIRRKWRRS